ncbi:monooxygenase [Xylaria venustula]|nr:monooxygenase [Xylaria venustula]
MLVPGIIIQLLYDCHQLPKMSAQAPIAIIGGGPGGLILARFLERAGLNYTVFERDGSPDDNLQGGTLDLHNGTGLTAIDAAGLRNEFEKYARYEASVFSSQDFQGGHRFRSKAGNYDRPEIDRKQLRSLLLQSISADRVRWGKAVKTIQRNKAEGWRLQFADGTVESGFRMIVGADGAFSAVRPLITPAKPKYSGKTYIEGRITPLNPQYAAAQDLAGPGGFTAIGAGRAVTLQQMSDTTYRIYAGIAEEDTSVTRAGGALDFSDDRIEKARAALLDRFADFAPHLRSLITHAEGPWRVWPLYTLAAEDFAPEAPWTRAAGVTLLGDAAHVALPNGEGVNIALLDALKLSESLAAEGGNRGDGEAAIERAIVRYEKEMRERAAEHVADGINMCDMLFSADGAQRIIAFFKQSEDAAGQA